jgi:hypothetical protein
VECTDTSGQPTWQPTDAYIPLRTLFHYLCGARAVGVFHLEPAGIALLFREDERYVLIAWSWQHAAAAEPLAVHAGAGCAVIDLYGRPVPASHDGAQLSIPLSESPVIITGVDAALMQLCDSFRVEPATIDLHDAGPPPVVKLRNYYPVVLSGSIDVRVPAGWSVRPNPIPLELAPGAALDEPLRIALPPRQIASGQALGVDVRIVRPMALELHFEIPLTVELKGLNLQVVVGWDHDDLVVEHTLTNHSEQPVSFATFCQAPTRARADGLLREVPPGAARIQRYRLPTARALAGQTLWLGIREIDGSRSLDQLVVVPP